MQAADKQNKENSNILKPGMLTDMCNELSATESLDTNVEKV
jgi:hypothetical protein